MNVEYEFSNRLIVFLSESEFYRSEFKDILRAFTHKYPEYNSDYYYQRIYKKIRYLATTRLLSIESTGIPFKYSTIKKTNNKSAAKSEAINFNIDNELQEIEIALERLQLELSFLASYKEKYQLIDKSTKKMEADYQKKISYLEAKFSFLKKMKASF
jgi:hypothetical protein